MVLMWFLRLLVVVEESNGEPAVPQGDVAASLQCTAASQQAMLMPRKMKMAIMAAA
jgi:hypothetical protein